MLATLSIYRAKLPLDRAYPVAYGALTELDALLCAARDTVGNVGWGEVTIIPGYTPETVEEGWDFCVAAAPGLIGQEIEAAKRLLQPRVKSQPHAVSAVMTALEMLEANPILRPPETARVALLAPIRSLDRQEIAREIEELLSVGHRTLKVKVGFHGVEEDLDRLSYIGSVVAGRARLRVDANQGYAPDAACRFAAALDPAAVELFEQPVGADDWDGLARVAASSSVPLMLDESVYGFEDIMRAAGVENIGYIKIEMEKFGGVELATAGLELIRTCGMEPVAGNGAASDISSWMEACTAVRAVRVPCEMHGFRKLRTPLLAEPLPFEDGDIVLRAGYWPTVDEEVVRAHATRQEHFGT